MPFNEGSARTAWRRLRLVQMCCGVTSCAFREVRHLPRAGGMNDVLHRHQQLGVVNLNADGLGLYEIAEPLLKSRLYEELRGCRELVAGRGKYHLQQSASQRRPIHPLAGARKQQ